MNKDLSKLPKHIVKTGKYWFQDSLTGKKIHVDRIHSHLPKTINQEDIINKRWDLKY